MTERYRACELGFCEPSRELFGVRYGVCPLKQECPENVVCGYAMTRRIIRDGVQWLAKTSTNDILILDDGEAQIKED